MLPIVDCLKLDNMDAVQVCMDRLEPWLELTETGESLRENTHPGARMRSAPQHEPDLLERWIDRIFPGVPACDEALPSGWSCDLSLEADDVADAAAFGEQRRCTQQCMCADHLTCQWRALPWDPCDACGDALTNREVRGLSCDVM